MLNVLFGALAQVVPDRIPAAYYAVSYVCSFQTVNADARKVLVEIEVGGCGGHPVQDGASAYSFGMHNNASIPIEMIESDTPLTITGYGLLPDTGGAGVHRGGLGLFREWRIESERATFTARWIAFACGLMVSRADNRERSERSRSFAMEKRRRFIPRSATCRCKRAISFVSKHPAAADMAIRRTGRATP